MGVPTSSGIAVMSADVAVDPATSCITVSRFSSSAVMVSAYVSAELAQFASGKADTSAITMASTAAMRHLLGLSGGNMSSGMLICSGASS